LATASARYAGKNSHLSDSNRQIPSQQGGFGQVTRMEIPHGAFNHESRPDYLPRMYRPLFFQKDRRRICGAPILFWDLHNSNRIRGGTAQVTRYAGTDKMISPQGLVVAEAAMNQPPWFRRYCGPASCRPALAGLGFLSEN
jgi:hypothetical protein